MKKLTRNSLDELAQRMPVLGEELQRSCIGGGDGSIGDPYSQREYDEFILSGYFPGGYVDLGGTDSPYYLGAAEGETTISGYYTNKDANQVMYDCGYAWGYERGLTDDSFWDYMESGFVFLSTTLTTEELRETEFETQRTYFSSGFAVGYQRGVADRSK